MATRINIQNRRLKPAIVDFKSKSKRYDDDAAQSGGRFFADLQGQRGAFPSGNE